MTVTVVSLSEFKAKAPQLLAELNASDGLIVVTENGLASAVVQGYESHQRERAALQALKRIVQREADVSAGRTMLQRSVFADIKAGLADGSTPPEVCPSTADGHRNPSRQSP
ncbi:MAG: type II toxin-antitoxin system Phd/YefM family antitoxin [Gammaproteobacteria bacterium]|nr:type II toxin-antitoxin system Phd/YefM family antitoxin [Gammaproteobacteria bacterium]